MDTFFFGFSSVITKSFCIKAHLYYPYINPELYILNQKPIINPSLLCTMNEKRADPFPNTYHYPLENYTFSFLHPKFLKSHKPHMCIFYKRRRRRRARDLEFINSKRQGKKNKKKQTRQMKHYPTSPDIFFFFFVL
jgi:hypothetical protein